MAEIILCDTNILIEVFKGSSPAISLIEQIGYAHLSISSITLMELYYGALNRKELEKIKKSFAGIQTFPVSERTTDIALHLIETYSKSHGLNIPDALIAATAIEHRTPLLTYNLKDFKFIKNLRLANFD